MKVRKAISGIPKRGIPCFGLHFARLSAPSFSFCHQSKKRIINRFTNQHSLYEKKLYS